MAVRFKIGIALSTPSPDNRAVVIFHGDTRPDDHPTTFPYTNIPPPSIIDVQPRSGPSAGGTSITITGTDFQPGATVSIAGVTAFSVNVISPVEITALTPPLPSSVPMGFVDVEVANPDGQFSIAHNGFEYTP